MKEKAKSQAFRGSRVTRALKFAEQVGLGPFYPYNSFYGLFLRSATKSSAIIGKNFIKILYQEC